MLLVSAVNPSFGKELAERIDLEKRRPK